MGFMDNNFPNELPADNIFLYDPVDDERIIGPTIPVNRRRGSAAEVVYDPQTNTWTQLANASRARDHFYAALQGDKMYVVVDADQVR